MDIAAFIIMIIAGMFSIEKNYCDIKQYHKEQKQEQKQVEDKTKESEKQDDRVQTRQRVHEF